MSDTTFTDLIFHVAPRDAGQIIEVAFALDIESSCYVRRETDRSDDAVSYMIAPFGDDDPEFEPINGAGWLHGLKWTVAS